MTDETPAHYTLEFGLRPLGYSRRNVAVAFAEGRMALHQLRSQAAELAGQIAKLEGDVERLRGELEAARAREDEVRRMAVAAEQKAAAIEGAAHERARAIVADAEERAILARGQATLQSEEVSRQIDELLRVRNELVGSARAAADRLHDAVARIERGEIDAPADVVERSPQTQTQSQSLPAPALEAAPPGVEGLFEASVELDAGPFADFAELSAFERAVGRMPKVQDVYIRRFADERASIEVTLVEAAPLVDMLRSVLPHSFEVVASTNRSLKIAVEAATPTLGRAR